MAFLQLEASREGKQARTLPSSHFKLHTWSAFSAKQTQFSAGGRGVSRAGKTAQLHTSNLTLAPTFAVKQSQSPPFGVDAETRNARAETISTHRTRDSRGVDRREYEKTKPISRHRTHPRFYASTLLRSHRPAGAAGRPDSGRNVARRHWKTFKSGQIWFDRIWKSAKILSF